MVLSTHQTGSPMHKFQAHGMIPYSSATSLKCCTNSAVEGHVLMFLGTGLSLPGLTNLDPTARILRRGKVRLPDFHCSDPNPPIGISFSWCILYICILHYMIVEDNILNKEHLGEEGWFDNQDALLDGYLEFLVPCLEARNTSLPGLPSIIFKLYPQQIRSLPSTNLAMLFNSWTKYQAGKKTKNHQKDTVGTPWYTLGSLTYSKAIPV